MTCCSVKSLHQLSAWSSTTALGTIPPDDRLDARPLDHSRLPHALLHRLLPPPPRLTRFRQLALLPLGDGVMSERARGARVGLIPLVLVLIAGIALVSRGKRRGEVLVVEAEDESVG